MKEAKRVDVSYLKFRPAYLLPLPLLIHSSPEVGTYTKFSEQLIFLTHLIGIRTCAYQVVRNGKFCVRTKWMILIVLFQECI